MELRCDLHLHTALSPCAHEEMTPQNLVNMARLLELGVIAVTDHNSVGNCRAVMEAARGTGLVVLPGMELFTSEEIHVICLFSDLERAEAFGTMVRETLPPIRNRPDSFGRQLLLDSEDHVIGEEELLLITASGIGIDRLPALVGEYGGVCWPAHIDRPSYSILSVLGELRLDMGFAIAELSRDADEARLLSRHPGLGRMTRLRASDAHDLEGMVLGEHQRISPARPSVRAVMEYLRGLSVAPQP